LLHAPLRLCLRSLELGELLESLAEVANRVGVCVPTSRPLACALEVVGALAREASARCVIRQCPQLGVELLRRARLQSLDGPPVQLAQRGLGDAPVRKLAQLVMDE